MKLKKALSALLSAAVLCGLLCVPAFAAEEEPAPASETVVEVENPPISGSSTITIKAPASETVVEVENGGKLVIEAMDTIETLKYGEAMINVYSIKPGVTVSKYFVADKNYSFTVCPATEAEGVITPAADMQSVFEKESPYPEIEYFRLALDEEDTLFLVEIHEGDAVMTFGLKNSALAQTEAPTESEQPETPTETEQPETPTESEQPTTPPVSVQPEAPAETEQPEQPTTSPEPEQTTTPPEPEQPSAPVPAGPGVYTVQKGDTLGYISVNYYGSYAYSKALYQANADAFQKTSGKLVPGMVLTLPDTLGDAVRLAPAQAGQGERLYTVQSGDTLSAIASSVYGSAKEYTAIFERNSDRIQNANRIYTGQVIVLPAPVK